VVIGRGSGSDVRLPDPSVSARHATIRAHSNGYVIVDEGSTNGTWVGGIRLSPQTPRAVKSGELVRVGRVWLELSVGNKAATADLGLATRDLAFLLVQRAMAATGDDTIAKVRVAEGADIGEEVRLTEEGRAYIVGRSETCDLPLADADASREHLVIARTGGQVWIRDLDSRNGLFLGDQQVIPGKDTAWRSPMMVRLGRTVLTLDEPVSVALAELEAAEDEQMHETEVPLLAPQVEEPPVEAIEPKPPSEPSIAPLSDVATSIEEMPRATTKKRGWSTTDLMVFALAVLIIAVSVGGLAWVLR
jgi:pSer/pThr/pTyr-binding forkhead associated (FHA) protein